MNTNSSQNRYSFAYLKDYFYSQGYELLESEYKNSHSKLSLKDHNGYLYYTTLNTIKHKNYKPSMVDKSNIYSIYNIKLWCEINKKPFIIIDNEEYKNKSHLLRWKCYKCKSIFEQTWTCIYSNGYGCSFCSGKRANETNCLATILPEIAHEWHPTKNGDLTPFDVTVGSKKYVWWQCKNNNTHIWYSTVKNRTQHSCPYCSHTLPSKEYNLLLSNPLLCEEWDYKNNLKSPEEYLPHSGKRVYWICKNGHEWEAEINSRTKGNSCPICNESKGEENIVKVLDKTNKLYYRQKMYENLLGLGNGLLSYDFYLPDYNLLIEYQGNYHDGTVGNQSEEDFLKQQEHDKRKREYAEQHNIELLEIWYWDFDKIEEILSEKLNLINIL
jgi:hypothetical protein